MISWLVNILEGVFASAVTYGATRAYDRSKRIRRYGYLRGLMSRGEVQVVIPDFHISQFTVRSNGTVAQIPPNIRVMPMAEGEAIADLIRVLRGLGRGRIKIVTQDHYRDGAGLTVTVGGPSVNAVTGALLTKRFPEFGLDYPEHEAHYGSIKYVPARAADGSLLEDFGFMAVSQTAGGHHWVGLFGVWAQGTRIATTVLLEQIDRSSELRRLINASRAFLAVSRADLVGLEAQDTQLIGTFRSPPNGR